MKRLYCVICGTYKRFKNPKISYISENALGLSIICSKWENKDKKIFKEEKLVEILQILGLIENICLLSKYGWNKCKPEI